MFSFSRKNRFAVYALFDGVRHIFVVFVSVVWAIVAYCLAQISKQQTAIFAFSLWKWLKIPALAGLLVGAYFLTKDIPFEYQWNRTAQASLLGQTKEMLPEYERLHRIWNGNPLFLYNFGAELNHIEEHEKSNVIFRQGLAYLNDYDVQMLLADNYSTFASILTC